MATFPQAQLPLRAFIAPGFDPGDPSSWTWTEITDDVRTADGVTVEVGRRDEEAHATPGKCSFTLDNRSGNYSTRNALGAYYGQLRRNTPFQLRVDRGVDTFTRSSGSGWGTSDSGMTWSHTSTSTWTVDGSQGVSTFAAANTAATATLGTAGALDIDVEYVVSVGAVTTGAAWVAAATLRKVDNNNYYGLHCEFQPGGAVKVKIAKTVAGSFSDLVAITDSGVTYSANTKIRVRAVAVGQVLSIKVWLDGDPEPDDWHATAEDTDLTGSLVGMLMWRVSGNTNVGSLSAKVDEFTSSAVVWTGFVSEWPVRWDQSANDSTVAITANGVLRRLQAGASPLRSPLYRQLISQSPAGYWPCEDGSDATSVGAAVTGVKAATVSDVSFASDSTLAGADSVLKVNSTSSRITGTISGKPNTPDGYAALALVKLASLPGSATNVIEWMGTGTVARWLIDADGSAFGITGFASDDSVVVARTTALFVVDPTEWTAIQLETSISGGTVTWVLIWHQVGSTDFWSMGSTYAGTAPKVTGFRIASPLADTAYGHIWAGDNDLPFVADSFSKASSGYAGEAALARIERLCDEEGLSILIEDDSADSELLGVQRTETVVDLLQAVEETDLGILYEVGGGLGYRPRPLRYNAAVDIALDVSSGHVAEPPEPTDDDQRITNDVTAKRDGGGQARYVDSSSIAEVGTYADEVTVSLSTDDRLDDHASWRGYVGTRPDLRWPRIVVDLARNTGLIDDFLALRIGYRVTVANPPDQMLGEEIDLLVEGYTMRLGPYEWAVELACSPAVVWQVGTLGTTPVDTDGSELTDDISSSDTSFDVDTTSGPLWTTSGTDFDVVIGGERMTVTAVSGASSPQTFTVTRAVNGVAKAHDGGTAVHVYRPLVAAL